MPLPARMLPCIVHRSPHAQRYQDPPRLRRDAVGLPYGFFDREHRLPIWKTGHVASEPDVDFEGEPTFLVDVSAFPACRGLVLAVATGIYESEDGVMRSGRVSSSCSASFPRCRSCTTGPSTSPAGSTDIQRRRPRCRCSWDTSGRRRSSPRSPAATVPDSRSTRARLL